MTNLERYEAMDTNQLLIELKDLASSAEQEAIFAKHPQLRPDYDFLTHIQQDSKIALRKSVEKMLEIMVKSMVLLLALDQKEGECRMQGMEELVADLAARVQDSTKKLLDLYTNSK
jgi:hypothetical protein